MSILKKILIIGMFNIGTLVFGLSREVISELKSEKATLTYAPFVPAHITRKEPRNVIIKMTYAEKDFVIVNGMHFKYSTFGNVVPGPFGRVREGDDVEWHLVNLTQNCITHLIDIYAATGRETVSTKIHPGQTIVLRFKALNAGLYIYQGVLDKHIAKGMSGLIFVQPKYNYSRVDKEFYIMKGEIYAFKKNKKTLKKAPIKISRSKIKKIKRLKKKDSISPKKIGVRQWKNIELSLESMRYENPDYIFFNGAFGRHTILGQELKVRVGDTVRMYVGNAGPNLILPFHVVGEIFDKVYLEGGAATDRHVQTVLIPPGGAAIVEFTIQEPGYYAFIDSSMFRAWNKGAAGFIIAKGMPDLNVFSSQKAIEKANRLKKAHEKKMREYLKRHSSG